MTLDLLVNGFRGFSIFPPKLHESQISVFDSRANFVQDPKFSGGHKNRPSGARDLIFMGEGPSRTRIGDSAIQQFSELPKSVM